MLLSGGFLLLQVYGEKAVKHLLALRAIFSHGMGTRGGGGGGGVNLHMS